MKKLLDVQILVLAFISFGTAAVLALAGCDDPLLTGIRAGALGIHGPSFTTIGTDADTHVVNNGPGDQTDPHISGSLVSYTSNADGTNRIRHHDLATSADAVVPNSGQDDFLSDISGSKVVFTRVGASSAIYVYETGATAATEVAPAGDANRRSPAIGGNTVAWQDFGFTPSMLTPEIVVHDLATATTTRLTNDALLDRQPAVSPDGNVVVWAKCQTNGTGCDIWKAVKSVGVWTSSAVTGSAGEEALPDVDGQFITYSSTRAGEADIYWQPVAGGAEQRLTLTGVQSNPSISEGLITFELRDAASNWDVWAYDTETDVAYQLTTATANEILNDVWVSPTGLVRVVYASDATGDFNVHALSFQRASADADEQLGQVADDVEAIMAANPGTPLADKLEDALAKLNSALARLAQAPPDRQAALGDLEGAVADIGAAVQSGLSSSEAVDLMDRIAAAARLLAGEAIAEAEARRGDAGKIAEAQDARAEGDARRAALQFKDAVAKYKDAVAKAEGA